MTARLQTANLQIAVPGRQLVRDLDLDIGPGEYVCVLGTNGAGKTLTLHTLAGLRAATGSIRLNGDLLESLSRPDVARRLGLLLQIHEDAFPLTVTDSVLMGCFPRLNFWQWAGDQELQAVQEALRCFDLQGLDERLITTLSGGERERVALATLMVQNPDIWLLDEPLNHLDPHHQIAVLEQLAAVAAGGRIVVTTVHNPALVMRFASHALLLYGDGEWEYGPAGELLEPERLERLYQTPFSYYQGSAAAAGRRVLLPA